jgi:hypothetical protein
MRAWWTGLLAAVLVGCVPAPTDPVATGSLCLPPSADCPDNVVISRDAVGRNQLDYAIVNHGATETTVTAQATVPATDLDAGTDVATDADFDTSSDAGDETGRIVIAREEHRIAPSGSVGNRWTPQLLGTRDPMEFSIACSGCDVQADFVLSTIPLQCSTDDDCSSGWLCDTRVPGRCVECRSDDDCSTDQTCDLDRGRCTPPTPNSCSTADAQVMVPLLLVLVAFRRRRHLTLKTGLIAALMVGFTPVQAAPPVASLGIGIGTHVFTGEVGEVTQPGLSLSIDQELRWQYVGLNLGITTSYFLTDQPSPPFSRDLRTASVHAGPRAYYPIGPIELMLGLDYVRLGLDSNSLVRITGPDLSYNALNVGAGVRYRWSGLEIRGEFGYQPVFDFPGDMISFQLGVAIASGS